MKNLKCGIIGLPNVGKSKLFNLLTGLNVLSKNFFFCTISPNYGFITIPDNRLYKLNKIVKSKRIINSYINIVDIAGLIKGSSKGEGLGNRFLSYIRDMEVLIHVVRCFIDDKIIHFSKDLNPENDINLINTELILYDLNICQKIIKNKKNIKLFKKNYYIIEKCYFHLNKLKMLKTLNLNKNELKIIQNLKFLTLKPIIYLANINKKKNVCEKYIKKVKKISKLENSFFISLQLNNINFSILKNKINKIINKIFNLLNLCTYFTFNTKELRSWNIKNGSTVIQAANKIHTDIGKGFIKAKIINFNDFIENKGEKKSKKLGKIKFEGKNYLIKEGDILQILFNI